MLLGGAAFGALAGYFVDQWLGPKPWILVRLSVLGISGFLRLPSGHVPDGKEMKESSSAAPDHFAWFAGGTLAVGLLGFGTTALAAAHPAARSAAWLGVGAAELFGLLGLSLNRWARSRSLHAVFAVDGSVFGLRLALV